MNVLCITNRKLSTRPFLEQIKIVAVCHPWGIVLREKDLAFSEYKALSLKVLDICAIENVRLILHGIDAASPAELMDFISDFNASSDEKFAGVHFSMGDFMEILKSQNFLSHDKSSLVSQKRHCENVDNFHNAKTDYKFCDNNPSSYEIKIFKANHHLGENIALGVSAHSLSDALFCEEQGASYITASHIFPTDCKKGLPPKGIPFLKDICDNTKIPVFALGGINEENAPDCLAAGAYGVSVMSECMKESFTIF